MRHLVTLRKIADLVPIEGADLIELAKIDGWTCVVKKGEFTVGAPCLYFEIDSFLPERPEFEFLRKSSSKKMDGVAGFRIKSSRRLGQLSQGLALPYTLFPEVVEAAHKTRIHDPENPYFDATDILGVKKYETPIPVEIAGKVRGNFPAFIKKTDQERCQNIGAKIFIDNADARYEVTLKMDGTSFTGFHVDDEYGVCSRNWELKVDESNTANALVRMYVDSGLQAALVKLGKNYAPQGELMGPGIENNREGFNTTRLYIFDIYDIDGSCHLAPDERHAVMEQLYAAGLDSRKVFHAPVFATNVTLADLGITNMQELLNDADGPSLVHAVREGKVYKRMDGKFTFKVISNSYLVK